MGQSEMNIRELMHKTGVDRMHVTLINDEPHPALIAFTDELEVHWKKLVGGRAGYSWLYGGQAKRPAIRFLRGRS